MPRVSVLLEANASLVLSGDHEKTDQTRPVQQDRLPAASRANGVDLEATADVRAEHEASAIPATRPPRRLLARW